MRIPVAALLIAALALPAHSTPLAADAKQADADRDVLCYALNASEAANARTAGQTDQFNQRMQWTMFFRGVAAERYKAGATFNAKRAEAIKALGLYLTNNGKDLLDSECQARMRVAMNTGG